MSTKAGMNHASTNKRKYGYEPGSQAAKADQYTRYGDYRSKASEADVIERPEEPLKTWFTIMQEGANSRVVARGTQERCLDYITKYVKDHPDENAIMFIAQGVKLTGY